MNEKDVLLWRTWESLSKDFCKDLLTRNLSLPPALVSLNRAIKDRDACAARRIYWPNYHVLEAQEAKMLYQLEAFPKRWTFSDDVYTEPELIEAAMDDFVSTQKTLISALPDDPITNRVVTGAASLCYAILGPYCQDEHKRRCRFGSRAAYNLKKSESYLFNRIRKISATRRQVEKWGKWVGDDCQLKAILLEEIRRHQKTGVNAKVAITDHLCLTVVPKTWKAGRTIVPDTILGGYIANGLGDIIQDRLRVYAGLDISKKSAEHHRMAMKASISGHLTTADMSKASDRISWPLLQRVLPSDWLEVLEADRIHLTEMSYVNPYTGKRRELGLTQVNSPLLMGKGYTFPLQTLVFYSLLLAIAIELGIGESYISVYGDDLIYPSKMHKYVAFVFPKLGLKLNPEKTFSGPSERLVATVKGCFRESCGGDFLRGCDIRPYMPQGASGESATKLEAVGKAQLCYTLLNGLLSRWKWYEIPTTVRYLLVEAQNCFGKVLVVPNTQAVASGLRYDEEGLVWLTMLEEHLNIAMPRLHRVIHPSLGGYLDVLRFSYISQKPPKVEIGEEDEYIYLWNALRLASGRTEPEIHHTFKLFERVPGFQDEWRKRLATLQKWETPEQQVIRCAVKEFLTADGTVHSEKPKHGPYRTVWRNISAVPSKVDVGHAVLVQGSCSPMDLYDALLAGK